jgi:regulator of sirC expression with transglutaminase-like and TPR domain
VRAAVTMYLTWLAATHAVCNDIERAVETVEQALTINPQEKFFRPESLRIRGELRLRAGNRGGGEADLRRALDDAKTMGAGALQQRAETSLRAI